MRFPFAEGEGLEGGRTGSRAQLAARTSACTGKICIWSEEEADFEDEMARMWVG